MQLLRSTLFLLAALTLMGGCNQIKFHTTTDMRTVPDEWNPGIAPLGQQSGSPVLHYDSLYVLTRKTRDRIMVTDFLRFWPNGRVLKQTSQPVKPGHPNAADGDDFSHGTVGHWKLNNDEITLYFFDLSADNEWDFVTQTGHVSDDTITITQEEWRHIKEKNKELPPAKLNQVYKRKPVDPMELDPDW